MHRHFRNTLAKKKHHTMCSGKICLVSLASSLGIVQAKALIVVESVVILLHLLMQKIGTTYAYRRKI